MNIRSVLVATAGLLSALSVAAVELRFTHAYGEIVDRGDVSVQDQFHGPRAARMRGRRTHGTATGSR